MSVPAAQLQNLLSFARFYTQAVTKYAIHSPFVSAFCAEVLEDRRRYYAFDTARQLRAHWLRQRQPVPSVALGASSRVSTDSVRTTDTLIRHGSIRPAQGELLFRLCQWLQPQTIVEMGTQLGIGTVYLRAGAPSARLFTLEGNPTLVDLARQTFQLGRAESIRQVPGPFATTLPTLIPTLPTVDLLYLDGDHRGTATREYVRQWLPSLSPGTCLVLDDIHWSRDMEQAWHDIRHWPEFSVSIDLFHLGLLFVQPTIHTPQHLSLLPWYWKPWRMGFFG